MDNNDLKQQAMKEMASRELSRRQSQPKQPMNVGDVANVVGKNLGKAVSNIPEEVGVMANTALLGIPGFISKKVSGKDVFAGNDLSPESKMMAEGAGMVAPVGGALKMIGEIPLIKSVGKFANPKNQVKLAEEVQNTLQSQKHDVIENYGKEYEKIVGNSNKKVNLDVPVKNFVDESQSLMQNPEFAQQVAAKNPQAMKIFDLTDKVSKAKGLDSMSAKEADNLSKYIKNLPGIKSKLAQASKQGWHTVQWSNEDRMLLGLADDIKGEVIQAHPDLQGLNQEYGQFMNSYKKVAPDFRIGSTISKLKDYHTYDPQKKELLEGILPKDTVNKIKEFNRANVMSNVLKKVGIGAAKGTGIGLGVEAGAEFMKHL